MRTVITMMKGSCCFQFILRVEGVDAVGALKAIDTVEATERADWRTIFKMKLDEHMLLWNQAAVKLMEIRHMIMNPGEGAGALPAAAKQL
jgi:hypothetical protein